MSLKDVDRVQLDISEAGKLAFSMLRARGGTKFAVLEPEDLTYTVAGRARVFAETCRSAGFPVQVIRPEGQDYENGFDIAGDIAANTDQIDAVFATADLMGLGLLDGLRHEHNVSVPDQIQIVASMILLRRDGPHTSCRPSARTLAMPRKTPWISWFNALKLRNAPLKPSRLN